MTETDIANMALSRLGERRISDISENSPSAISCRTHYEVVRDSLLRSHPWNFATARATLSATTTPEFKWAYAYTLPAGFLRLSTFNGKEADAAISEYRVEGNEILTDANSASITYVQKVSDPTLFDSLFLEVIVFRLASAIAMDITSEPTTRDNMEQLAAMRMQDASFVDANENKARVQSPTSERTSRVRGIPQGLAYPYDTQNP
jgi:hypothetical protein